MHRKTYRKRLIDVQLQEYLSAFGAVCIEGPKWCGKTWTGSFHSRSEVYLGDPKGNFQNRALAQMNPPLVLEGEQPRLIDEWQEVPQLWDAVRFAVDSNTNKGQFILTGSATPNHKGVMHSGAGRIGRVRMRPMSLFEAGRSSGIVSLGDLCNGTLEPQFTGEVQLADLIDAIVRGGWPSNQELPLRQASLLSQEYLTAILADEVYRMDGIARDNRKLELLLRSLARNDSTTVTNKRLQEDIREVDYQDIVVETVATYLDVLNRLFLLDNQKPFSSRLRSSVRVKQAEKRHLADPSLACALLKATPDKLMGDLQTLGFMFESLCVRDLKIYAESFGAEICHYQDYNNREMDAVLVLPSGEWCGIEIKLGAHQIEAAAQNLLKISREATRDDPSKAPKMLCVVCGLSNAAYQRPDGVFVVPVSALKN